MTEPNLIQNSKIKLTFCPRGKEPPKATAQLLPILVDSCPENFSTVDYFMVSNYKDVTVVTIIIKLIFQTLNTEKIGRMVIYSTVMTSSMDVLSNIKFGHGLVVISLKQTFGKGRNDNQVRILFLVLELNGLTKHFYLVA